MNAPDALQNIRSKHPVAYVVLYLFVGWALLVVITHAIAFGAELLIASSDQPVPLPRVQGQDKGLQDCRCRTGLFIYNRSNRQRRASRVHGRPCDVSYRPQHPRPTVTRLSARMRYTRHHTTHVRNTDAPGQGALEELEALSPASSVLACPEKDNVRPESEKTRHRLVRLRKQNAR